MNKLVSDERPFMDQILHQLKNFIDGNFMKI